MLNEKSKNANEYRVVMPVSLIFSASLRYNFVFEKILDFFNKVLCKTVEPATALLFITLREWSGLMNTLFLLLLSLFQKLHHKQMFKQSCRQCLLKKAAFKR